MNSAAAGLRFMPDFSHSTVGLLLSGGLDSAILLGHFLRQHQTVRPFYICSNLVWETAELQAVRGLVKALASPRLAELVVLKLPVSDVYDGHWSVTGNGTPDAQSADDAVYLPGRNAVLIVKAALWCQLHDIRELALGVLGSNPFADASAAFFEQFQGALNLATGAGLRILRPFANLEKRDVMELGRGLPLGLTFSCIAPVDGLHCGRCNKCAERQKAFRLIDSPDPTCYAAGAAVPGMNGQVH
ncbi:MAG: 7-cyano-7-deazaguanine synthase [Thermoguttaceae bacterium]